MEQVPEENYSPVWADDTRGKLALVGTEREILTAILDWHRETFRLKCVGLTREQLSERAIPPSRLTLHGLLRHLAGTEQYWFEEQFAGRETVPLYYTNEDPDQDFEDLDGDPAEVLAVWAAQCDMSRAIVAEAPSMETTGTHHRTGEPIMLRRILAHMIAEYARHNGHADLLRERLDGKTGM
ncbi:MAG TPA: DinB family protein [Actinokineospora sp.]|jgi:hypothetical protein|nr:DinB family protein [Actinokineospora sp.]